MRDPVAPAVVVERLRRRSDFRSAANALRSSGSLLAVQARRRDDDGVVRIGLTVSRQVGNAVERNRVRRRLREAVRHVATESRMLPGHDYVLIGRRAALAAPFADIMRDLHAALRRIHAGPRSAERGGAGGSRRSSPNHSGERTSPPQGGRPPLSASRSSELPSSDHPPQPS